jgi:hypothetical protein
MDTIFVVVNRFFKLIKFTLTQTNITIARTTKLFFDIWIQHNGMMEVIMNYWELKSTSKFWTLLMKMVGIKLKFSSTTFHL